MPERSTIIIKHATLRDNIPAIVAGIRPIEWDDANEMEPYDESALREYLAHDDNVLLLAYDGDEIVGQLLATKIYSPYASGRSCWMYVDELDTKPSHRRRGIARTLMEKIFEIAREWEIEEVYLGTESDNSNARKFYESLGPLDTEEAVGYTFRTM